MKRIKKRSIGYNTILSTNGVISAKGVKSKPNSIEVSGYTHEIGEGEKSPDNPYQLVNLDSGNVNLYNPDSISEIVVTNEGAIRKGIELDVSKFRSGYISIFHTSSIDISDSTSLQKGINIKFFRNGKYDNWTNWSLVLNSRTEKIPEYVSKILLYETNVSNAGFDIYQNLTILDSPILPTEPITDEHSIVLSNNDKTIQVPTPIPLNSVEGVSDYLYKDDGRWKLVQNIGKFVAKGTENFQAYNSIFYLDNNFGCLKSEGIICKSNFFKCIANETSAGKFASTSVENSMCFRYDPERPEYPSALYIKSSSYTTVADFKSFLAEQYEIGTPLTVIYQLETPIVHVLSDYAQELLNSFTLQNQNEISVEGHPNIEISGYIQK